MKFANKLLIWQNAPAWTTTELLHGPRLHTKKHFSRLFSSFWLISAAFCGSQIKTHTQGSMMRRKKASWRESAQTPESWSMCWRNENSRRRGMSREASDWWKRSVMSSAHWWPSKIQIHLCHSWAEHDSFAHQDGAIHATLLFKSKSKVTSQLNQSIPLSTH